MSSGSNNSLSRIYQGGIRFFASVGAANWIGIRSIASPASNLDIKLLTSLPVATRVLTIDQTGQIATGASDGTGGGGGEANTASSPSTAPLGRSVFWQKVGVDLRFYKLLPVNTPALRMEQGIDTIDFYIDPVVAAGNAGLMTGTDKTKLDGMAPGATANANNAFLLARGNHTGTQDQSTITGLGSAALQNVSAFQGANARLAAIAGFAAPTSVKFTQLGTDGVITLVDPPTGFNPGSQSANFIYAAPNGAAGNPVFRALAFGDVSSLIGVAASTLAAGNDARFHARNQDTGTNSQTFILDTGGTPIMIKDVGGEFQFRNGADTANANITANNATFSNLTVSGTTTVINTTELQVGDNIITLNADVLATTTPTENAGVEINRGNATAAQLIWDETTDQWVAGINGALFKIAQSRLFSFTNANLTSGVITLTHGLNGFPSGVAIYDGNNDLWGTIDNIRAATANSVTLDFTTLGALVGTWKAAITV